MFELEGECWRIRWIIALKSGLLFWIVSALVVGVYVVVGTGGVAFGGGRKL